MPPCQTLEKTIRTDFINRWTGWFETYQPGLGGGTGVPDIQIMAHPPRITPIEMKRGIIASNRLIAAEIRPDQVSWHTRFALAGGKSYFYIGALTDGELRRFIVEAMLAIAARDGGLILGSRAVELSIGDMKTNDKLFSTDLKNFLL